MEEFDPIQLGREINAGVDEALDAIADDSVATLKSVLGKTGSQASQPGEPPHKRSGELQASIQKTTVEDHEVTVYSDVPYAEYLEFGTQKMAARPFFTPQEEHIEETLEEVIVHHLGNVGK